MSIRRSSFALILAAFCFAGPLLLLTPASGGPARQGDVLLTANPLGMTLSSWNSSDQVTGTSRPTNCFAKPYVCDFPDPAHTWVSGDNAWASGSGGVGPYCDGQLAALISCTPNTAVSCTALPKRSAGGALSGTVSDTDIIGSVSASKGVTLHDDCITATGTNVARSGSAAVALTGGTSTITDTTISSVSASQMMEDGVANFSGKTATLSHDYVYDFGSTLHNGNWNVSDSYIFTTDGSFAYNGSGAPGPCTSQCPESTQDVFFNAGTTATFTHDTILNPHGEDILSGSGQHGGEGAVIFGDDYTGEPCSEILTVTHSLLAGGDSVITTCGNGKAPSAGTSMLDITDNDYARCTTATIGYSPSGDTNSVTCQGATVPATASNSGAGVFPGSDSHGYAPNGGGRLVNGIQYCVGTVSGNYWDDTGQTAAQPGIGTQPLNTCGNRVSPVEQAEYNNWLLTGTLTPKRLGQAITLPDGSTFNGSGELNTETGQGSVKGRLSIPPFTATVKLFGLMAVSIGMTLTPTQPIEGSAADSVTVSGDETLTVPVKLRLTITSIGLLGLKIPTKCTTSEPIAPSLVDTLGREELLTTGWHFSGTSKLPPFKCEGGLLGALFGQVLTELMSGPENSYTIGVGAPSP
jgi:hypothetical protein